MFSFVSVCDSVYQEIGFPVTITRDVLDHIVQGPTLPCTPPPDLPPHCIYEGKKPIHNYFVKLLKLQVVWASGLRHSAVSYGGKISYSQFLDACL